MEVPGFVCRALHRIHPELRLAWHGRERRFEDGDELNLGSFALIQLLPAQVVGSLAEPLIYSELWDVSPRINDGGNLEMMKVNRGPIFNKNGGVAPDWDPLAKIPIYNICLASMGFTNERVVNGDFLKFVPAWLESAKSRFKRSMEQAYKDHKSELDSMSSEATDFLWREAQRSTANSPIVPWEFGKEEVYNYMEKKSSSRSLESCYKV